MAHEQSTRAELRRLYVFERLSLERAAELCKVSVATARRWKASAEKAGDDWERVRAAHTMAVLQFKATMDELGNVKIDAAERVALLTSLSDSYNKAISANRKLLPETSRLATALEVINRLADYLKRKRPELLGAFLEVLEDFGVELERDLK